MSEWLMETNPRKVYEKSTGEVVNIDHFSSVSKYCQWLETELAHEYMDNKLEEDSQHHADKH